MSTTTHPVIERYLDRFSAALSDLPERERAEVVGEIRNHAAEAVRSGDDPVEVLDRLGAPVELARAYRVELTFEEPRRGISGVTRAFTIVGLAAVSSLPSFIVIVILGSLALGLTGGGVMATLLGVASLVLPGTFIESTLTVPQPISELLAVGLGVALTVAGIVSGALLYFYIRTLGRAFRRVVADLKAA